jgi:hypothetical protein
VIEILYNWRRKGNVITHRVIGLGHKKGNTNYGQTYFLTIIDEEDAKTGETLYAVMLFGSGLWFKKLKYQYESFMKRSWYDEKY